MISTNKTTTRQGLGPNRLHGYGLSRTTQRHGLGPNGLHGFAPFSYPLPDPNVPNRLLGDVTTDLEDLYDTAYVDVASAVPSSMSVTEVAVIGGIALLGLVLLLKKK